MKESEDLNKLKVLIKDIHIAMLSTIKDGHIRSRPMATSEIDQEGTIWFFTKDDSGKIAEIDKNDSVTLNYTNIATNTYVTIIGKVELTEDKGKINQLWNPRLKAWFPKGETDPEIGLLKFTPGNVEYWDDNSSKMIVLINKIKSAITGHGSDNFEHGNFPLK